MNPIPFTADQIERKSPRAMRPKTRLTLAALLLAAAVAAGCGGGAPTPTKETTEPEPASGAVLESAPTAQPAGAADATTLPINAQNPFVASISAEAVRQSTSAKRVLGASAPLPLEWLDATPPVGVPGAPVIVVVPGALPGRDNTMSLTPGQPTSLR
jgi:hypothetical protein